MNTEERERHAAALAKLGWGYEEGRGFVPVDGPDVPVLAPADAAALYRWALRDVPATITPTLAGGERVGRALAFLLVVAGDELGPGEPEG